jgi:hypothetical protein
MLTRECRRSQADIVFVIAESLPSGGTVPPRLAECLLGHALMQGGRTGNLHSARARAAALGALSRGLGVASEGGGKEELSIQHQELLEGVLRECCEPRLCRCRCRRLAGRWCCHGVRVAGVV